MQTKGNPVRLVMGSNKLKLVTVRNLLFLVSASLGAAPLLCAQARAEGVVVSAATGLPLEKVSVQFLEPTQGYLTVTDANGRFSFRDIQPGEYALSAERPGYNKLEIGLYGLAGRSTVLTSGDSLSGIVLKLEPQGLIAGSVLGPDGAPLLSTSLQLWRIGFENGHRVVRNVNTSASVDADGSFVIGGLSSGRYYLAAKEAG
jgi:hypothetical protein